jgi:hypothetical protein
MEKLFAKIKKETLDEDEKIKILSSLRNFVSENPAQIKSPFYNPWLVFMRQKMVLIPVAFVFVFILTGSTIFAAKNSLPGNILYPIKMLREGVESSIAINTKSRAQIEAVHAISRLKEVEQIVSSNGQLNNDVGKQIENNFQTQLQSVTSNINELENNNQKEDASIIWTDFKKSVAEHEKTITELSSSTKIETDTKKELNRVVSNIHSQIEKVSNENGTSTDDNKINSKKSNSSESGKRND